jgi:hypothetical protein
VTTSQRTPAAAVAAATEMLTRPRFHTHCGETHTPGPCSDGVTRPVAYRQPQLVDDVVRDLVSNYPGTIQSVNLPTPDTGMIRLHRGDSTWLVSIARLDVTDGT